MQALNFATRLKLLHGICLAETLNDGKPNSVLETYDTLDAADFLASFLTFKSIQDAGRNPALERKEQFDMLSVYQTFGLLVYAFLTLPLGSEGIAPDFQKAQVTIAKTLFSGISEQELVEILQSGHHKFQLIADAEAEHWAEYRENLDKCIISFMIAGTDDDSPHAKEDVLPVLSQLLSQLCEAFGSV